MSRRAVVILTAMVMWGAAGAAPASAHQSPPGCLVNGLNFTLAKSGSIFRQGDTATFTILAENINPPFPVGSLACDITAATLGFNPPNADGSENQNINDPAAVVVGTAQNYLNGFKFAQVASFNWVVNLNPTVTIAYGLATVRGTLHDTPGDHTFAQIGKDLGIEVTNPVLHIDKVGSIAAGLAPQNVTYTYIVRNDSTTPVPMNKVTVSDNLCTNPTYVGGDGGDGLLSNGESWTYSCTMLHQAPGVYTNTAQACAYSTVPGDTTRPVCSNQAQWTVTVTKPAGGVKGASAQKSPKRCVSLPTSLKVRAKELTTVRVHVAQNGKNIPKSVVKLSGVGVKRTGKTGKNGVVTFRVRPKHSGRLVISSDHCVPAARVSVKPARRVVAPRLPQVTG
jgi:uncharacterized repeat protein (TIGR01451 family)